MFGQGSMAAPDAELAEALHAMKGALNRVGNNVSQIARRMNNAKNRGKALPFSETDHVEIRHLAGMVLDFADEVALMAGHCCRTIAVKDSLSIEWIEATGFQPVRFSERMRGLLDFEAARRVKLQNPGDPS